MGKDSYTGEELEWSKISTYDNRRARSGGREYKAQFAMMPTVDHYKDRSGELNFRICAWRTNDAKSDLSYDDFVDLCRLVLAWYDGTVGKKVDGRSPARLGGMVIGPRPG